MNREKFDQWIAALRSGTYDQGSDYLHKDGKYCCVGVYCHLNDIPTSMEDNNGVSIDLGMVPHPHNLHAKEDISHKGFFASLNDGIDSWQIDGFINELGIDVEARSYSFEEIADILEQNSMTLCGV